MVTDVWSVRVVMFGSPVHLQVQMLLEAQGKFQPSTERVRSTASIAVGTGVL